MISIQGVVIKLIYFGEDGEKISTDYLNIKYFKQMKGEPKL